MKVEIKNKNKSSKKVIIIFILFVLACGIGGFIVGFLGGMYLPEDLDIRDIGLAISPYLNYAVPSLSILLLVSSILICVFSLKRAKRFYKTWDGEDESHVEKAEKALSVCGVVSNIFYILEIFLFSVWIHNMMSYQGEDIFTGMMDVVMIVFLILSIILYIVFQRLFVESAKKLNPEKRGEVLSFHFKKDWEKSCDEAELFVIYKSAYAAFKKVNFTCMALWAISVIGDIFLKIGLVPVVFVTIIWLVSLISYYTEAAKLEKKQKK